MIHPSAFPTTQSATRAEIRKRYDLLQQMVGTFYPAIVRREIEQLEEHLEKLSKVPEYSTQPATLTSPPGEP